MCVRNRSDGGDELTLRFVGTWPQFFFYPNLPDKITMWYDSHAAEAATHNVTKGVKRRLSVDGV